MKRVKKHRPLTDEEMTQLKIKPQWWIDKTTNTEIKDRRKTQFAGYAELLYHRLYDQFSNLIIEYDDGKDVKAEQTRKDILETIAEAGYDLVKHTLEHAPITEYDCYPWDIPDLTETKSEAKQ